MGGGTMKYLINTWRTPENGNLFRCHLPNNLFAFMI